MEWPNMWLHEDSQAVRYNLRLHLEHCTVIQNIPVVPTLKINMKYYSQVAINVGEIQKREN